MSPWATASPSSEKRAQPGSTSSHRQPGSTRSRAAHRQGSSDASGSSHRQERRPRSHPESVAIYLSVKRGGSARGSRGGNQEHHESLSRQPSPAPFKPNAGACQVSTYTETRRATYALPHTPCTPSSHGARARSSRLGLGRSSRQTRQLQHTSTRPRWQTRQRIAPHDRVRRLRTTRRAPPHPSNPHLPDEEGTPATPHPLTPSPPPGHDDWCTCFSRARD